MPGKPLILYVPGLKPKPEPVVHRQQLFRCLHEGLRRLDADAAAAMSASPEVFEIVPWTYDFYGVHRDMELDLADIDTLLTRTEASTDERAIATSWHRRSLRWLFRSADFLPFTIPKLATEELEVHLHDLNRYVRNARGVGDAAREKLRDALQEAHRADRPVLLLAHSMGSVIAFEVLWQLTAEVKNDLRVSLFLTMGSPLGQKLIQRRLLSAKSGTAEKYPANIDTWINLAAYGELTAIDVALRNDFGEMVERGLVDDIDDRQMFNYYRMHGTLNVHAEYGYLVNEVTAGVIGDWWRSQSALQAQASV